MKAKYSEYDSKGRLYVDCVECDRGINGDDEDKCSSGAKCKKGHQGGCFCGELIKGLELSK